MDGTNADSLSNIGDTLGSILSNPALMSKISAIASSLSGDGQNPTTAASAPVADAPPPGNAAPSGLASALSNPELLSKLPEVMATIAPLLSGNSSGNDNNVEQKSRDQGGHEDYAAPSAPIASIKTDAPCRADRTALLCALKPYMSPRRREAIDYIIKIDRIGDLLHNLT